jgi:ClpP class serine protease
VNADENMTLRDGVATINVTGPLFRYANIFTLISGATAYATLATDLQQALDSTQVRGIILAIDSPGGEVNGSAEFANMVFAVRGKKPIVAYVSGMAASAAYWIASAADEVVVAPTAIVGSIGAVIAISDRTKADEARGIRTIEIVSSQSPKKRLSPTSAEGQSEIQLLVDNLAQVFIDADSRRIAASAPRPCSPISERAECSWARPRSTPVSPIASEATSSCRPSSPSGSYVATPLPAASKQQPNPRIQR